MLCWVAASAGRDLDTTEPSPASAVEPAASGARAQGDAPFPKIRDRILMGIREESGPVEVVEMQVGRKVTVKPSDPDLRYGIPSCICSVSKNLLDHMLALPSCAVSAPW